MSGMMALVLTVRSPVRRQERNRAMLSLSVSDWRGSPQRGQCGEFVGGYGRSWACRFVG